MKRYTLLLLVLGVLSSNTYTNESKTQNEQKVEWCYCSVKCGPRKVEPGDRPFIDEETGMCFCQERDKALYYRCNGQPKPEYTSYCDTHQTPKK